MSDPMQKQTPHYLKATVKAIAILLAIVIFVGFWLLVGWPDIFFAILDRLGVTR